MPTWDTKALKATPLAADEILIIDTADSRNQKRATLSSLPVGDVVGPATTTNNAITRYDGTTGKLVENSLVVLDDTGNLLGAASLRFIENLVAPSITEPYIQELTSNTLRVHGNAQVDIATAGTTRVSFSATQADFQGNNLVNAVTTGTVTGVSGITGLGIQAQDLDMNGFNVDLGTGQINFNAVGQNIDSGGGGIFYSVPIVDKHTFSVNSVSIAEISSTGISLLNNLDLNLGSGEIIGFAAGQEIDSNVLGWLFKVPTGDGFEYQVNSVQEYNFDATQADWNGNNLIGLGGITMNDAADIVLNATTGTKIGTGTTQKLGFWNVTPVVQPGHIVDADGSLADATTKINAILADLAELGLQAAS